VWPSLPLILLWWLSLYVWCAKSSLQTARTWADTPIFLPHIPDLMAQCLCTLIVFWWHLIWILVHLLSKMCKFVMMVFQYNYYDSGHYPSSWLLLKTQHFRYCILPPLTPFNFPFYLLHVSAPMGHPQVRYTISYHFCFWRTISIQRICCTYAIWL
jgi:hypothetical protein